ncbi:MAG: hypothetical protein IKP88_14860 [Lachnospiraceae bacterium]|nr:hypothetical protein [Lachnospiraceae bacterium]
MVLNDRIYTFLKWFALICIPAVVTFLSVVLSACSVDAKAINIITTILTAIGTLIGTLIGVSTSAYNKQKGEGNVEDKSEEK